LEKIIAVCAVITRLGDKCLFQITIKMPIQNSYTRINKIS